VSTFIQKLRTVTLGTVHDLLDKAIDLNSPSALRQYVRDLEDALDRLKNEAAIQAGQIRTLTREQGDLQTRINIGKVAAAKYLATNRSDLARLKASEVLRAQQDLDRNIAQLETQKQTSAGLDAAVAKLEARHEEMVANVRRLESLDRESKAKEQAAASLTTAGKLVSGGVDINVDDLQSRMQARNDVATEKFNRAMGDVHVDSDPEHEAQVDDFLATLAPATKTSSAV